MQVYGQNIYLILAWRHATNKIKTLGITNYIYTNNTATVRFLLDIPTWWLNDVIIPELPKSLAAGVIIP